MNITHEDGCAAQRVEHFRTVRDNGLAAVTWRCVDCGGQVVQMQPDAPLQPGSAAFRQAWTHQPSRITQHLHPADLRDPSKNPLHPLASSTPPGVPLAPSPRMADWPAHVPLTRSSR